MRSLYIKIFSIILVIFSACDGYEPEVSTQGPAPDLTTVEVLQANDYTILVEALNITGLSFGSGEATLFAPTNDAFRALFTQLGVANVSEVDVATLTAVLEYHLVDGRVLSTDLSTSTVTASNGEPIGVFVGEDDIILNGKSVIVDADRVSANGAIHGINNVLSAPSGNLVETLLADPEGDYNILASAVTEAGLVGTFTGTTEYTIFAPTDAAFEDVFASLALDSASFVNLPDETLTAILSFHVVPGNVFSQQLPAEGKVATILGTEEDGQEELLVDGGVIRTYITGSEYSEAEITDVNILASNGVIHSIDLPLFELGSLFDFIDPDSDTPKTGGDNAAPNAIDNFGEIVESLNYERLLSLTDTSTILISPTTPAYASFADDEEATAYLERFVFDGFFDISGFDNGDRVTSVGGDEYYVVEGISGGSALSTLMGAAATNGFTYNTYNGDAFRMDADFSPIPETSVEDALAAAGYEMMSAALVITGRAGGLNSGDNTFFTVDNALLQSFTGLADSTAIAELDPDSPFDAPIIADLDELLGNHIVAEGANYAFHLLTVLPTINTVSEEELFFAEVGGGPVIVLDPKDPQNTTVAVVAGDISYANGVIHEVDDAIEFD